MSKKVEKRVCSVEGCNGKVNAKGMCDKHYRQVKKHGKIMPDRTVYKEGTKCIVEGCDCTKILAKGMCNKHYKQMYRHGKIINTKSGYEENEIIHHDDYAEVILKTQNGEYNGSILIDLDDVDLIKQYHWCSTSSYVITKYNGETIHMHRLIMGLEDKSLMVDHINRDTNDNRKSNLRIATPQQNAMNKSIQPNNTSGVPGVSFRKDRGKWRAFITVNKKQISLGMFEDKEDAIRARKEAEKKYFGEFAPK